MDGGQEWSTSGGSLIRKIKKPIYASSSKQEVCKTFADRLRRCKSFCWHISHCDGMVDMLVLETSASQRAGSSPASGTQGRLAQR